MDNILYWALVLIRGVLFPDFRSPISIAAIHLVFPVVFALVNLNYPCRPCWRRLSFRFGKGVVFLLAAEVLAVVVYAMSGGLPYILGADLTPALLLISTVAQVVIYLLAIAAATVLRRLQSRSENSRDQR